MGENLEFTRNLREIYEKKTSEVDLGVVKDKGGGEQFLNNKYNKNNQTTIKNNRGQIRRHNNASRWYNSIPLQTFSSN